MKTILIKRYYQLLYLVLLGVLTLGQLQRWQLTPNIAMYVHDLIIMLWLLSSFATHWSAWMSLLSVVKKWLYQQKILLLLLSWSLLGLIINTTLTGEMTAWLYLARATAYVSFSLSLKFITPFNFNQMKWSWISVGMIFLVGGLLQYFYLPDTRFLYELGWDDHFYRLIGTMLDPGFSGIIFVMTLIMLYSIKSLPNKLLIALSLPLTLGIALTYSRATYLALVVGSLVLIGQQWLWKQRRDWLLVLCSGLLVCSLPFLPNPGGEGVDLSRTSSIVARQTSTQKMITNLKPYQLIIGRGLLNPASTTITSDIPDTAHFPDNLLVFIFISTGMVGLGLFLAGLVKVGQYFFKRQPYLLSLSLAVFIHSQFNHTLFQPMVMIIFSSWLVLELANSSSKVEK